jgi:hypothetical protein
MFHFVFLPSRVIPGRAKGASPESISTIGEEPSLQLLLMHLWLWIPGSSLRSAPE